MKSIKKYKFKLIKTYVIVAENAFWRPLYNSNNDLKFNERLVNNFYITIRIH